MAITKQDLSNHSYGNWCLMKTYTFYLAAAIKNLTNNAEFVLYKDDYSTIEWFNFEGKAPTKAAVEAEIEKIKSAELAEVEATLAAKSELLAKLGITEAEAKLLLA